MTTRRSFLTGLGAILMTAPAIVRAGSLMPVKAMLWTPEIVWRDWPYRVFGRDQFGNQVEEIMHLGPPRFMLCGKTMFREIERVVALQ